MFYDTQDNRHGLPHDPFKAIVAPRPIGWIGTRGTDGSINLGPYSFFNAICDRPKMVMFSSSGHKHSVINIEQTGVFTASLVSADLAEAMNMSSAAVDYGIDEFALAGLTARQGRLIDAPYVGEAHAVLECRMTEIIRPRTIDDGVAENYMVIGQVVGIHIDENIIRDGLLDMKLARPIARMGYHEYCESSQTFEMRRPSVPSGNPR